MYKTTMKKTQTEYAQNFTDASTDVSQTHCLVRFTTNIAWMETAMWNNVVNKQLEMEQDTGLFAKQHGKISYGIVIGADTQTPFV